MNINFKVVNNKTPFKCMTMGSPWNNKPAFWVSPERSFFPKSKAAATGLVFTDKEVALEITCRFIAQQIGAWPELAERYKAFLSGFKKESDDASGENGKEIKCEK